MRRGCRLSPWRRGEELGAAEQRWGLIPSMGVGGLGRESKWESDVTGWTFQ